MNRSTPLVRNVALERVPLRITASRAGNFPAAGKGRSSSGKLTPPAPSEFSKKVRLLVRKRAGRGDVFEAQAECCGAHLGEDAGEFQHRAARGAGGCKDAVINGPANCLLMCHDCHRQAEDRDPHLGMDEAGFWIKHGTTAEYDPRNVPVMLHGQGSGLVVYLAADGIGLDGTGYLLQRPEVLAA